MSQTLSDAIRETLADAMERDPTVVLLGESVGRGGGVGGCVRGLLERFGEERVRDLPVAERGNAGLALGLALGGRRPVLELTSPGRLLAVVEVLAEAASIASAGEFAVPMVLRVPFGEEAGPVLDRPMLDILVGIAGVRVFVPSDARLGGALLRRALNADASSVLLEPRALYGSRDSHEEARLVGDSRLLRLGTHVTLTAWGTAVSAALTAAIELSRHGIEAEVLDLFTLAPLDTEALEASVKRTGRLVVAMNGVLGAPVVDVLRGTAFEFLEAPPATVPADVGAVIEAARAAVVF